MKNKKKNSIIILLLVILTITIGYGLLSSNLNIVGTSNINNANWDVHWNNVAVTEESVTGTQVTTAAHIITGNTEVEYSITLDTPGDFYEFTVDAVNAGSIDAMIGSFSNKVFESNGTTERTLPEYLAYTVTYEDGIAVANNHLLSANTTETYKVRVEYKTDINANQLPSATDTLVFKFNINYVQADSNSINRPLTYVYTVNVYQSTRVGAAIPNGVTIYRTYQDAIVANGGHNVFLKHKLENNIITETYVGFVYNNNDYYLHGIAPDDFSISPYYEENSYILANVFRSNCREYPACAGSCYYTEGSDAGITAVAFSHGTVNATDGEFTCYHGDDGGYSYCFE